MTDVARFYSSMLTLDEKKVPAHKRPNELQQGLSE